MTTDADTTSTTQDGVRFNDDGTVTLVVDGDVIRISTPKFGIFKAVKRMAFEVAEAVQQQAADTNVDLATLMLQQNVGTLDPKVEALVDASVDKTFDIIEFVVEKLGGGKTLPERDEWPTWLVTSNDLLAKILQHWRTVPLGRG